MTGHAAYCQLSDVQGRLYAGSGQAVGAAADTYRDGLLESLIQQVSRAFDRATDRPINGFAPVYDQRLFLGRGAQLLDLDHFATLTKVEVNTTPGAAPTWSDVTADLASQQMVGLPPAGWPKRQLFRQKTFYVDPYRTGNVRVTGVYGTVQPDAGAVVPAPGAPGFPATLTQGQINAMQPLDPTGAAAGWWVTPEDVTMAVAEWTLYRFKSAQAGYGDTGGSTGGVQGLIYSKALPPQVQDVIQDYREDRIHLALIGLDGSDAKEEATYPSGGVQGLSRWAGWQT